MHTINKIYVYVVLSLPVPLPNDYHAPPDYGQKPAHGQLDIIPQNYSGSAFLQPNVVLI